MVVAVVVGAVVGSGAVWVCCRLVAGGEVATTVWSFALERSVSHSAEAAPAAAATTRASSDGQIQSPGYQPSRLRQAEPSLATSPLRAGSREPHSRQYSWPGLEGVPQRGQRSSGSGAAVAYLSQASARASAGTSGALSAGRASRPQPAQNLASAGSG